MTVTERSERTRPGWAVFCLLVFGGTIAWAARFTVGYLLVPTACEIGDWILHLVTVLAAAGALAALLLSIRWARRTDDTAVAFALWAGAALDLFFLGAILLEGSGALFVDACMKGAIP